jgi:hypothetical protein
MRHIFFPTREAARACPVGKYADMGKEAPKGERHARAVPGVSGNARQRRQSLRRVIRATVGA